MAELPCPATGCDYIVPDVDPVLAAALLNAHVTTEHRAERGSKKNIKAEKVKRPTISSSGTSEDWAYFRSRWGDYAKAVDLEGPDIVVQLLECCDEQLRRDLTRDACGTLVMKTEKDVLAAMKLLAVRDENFSVARFKTCTRTETSRYDDSGPDCEDRPAFAGW